MRTVSTLCLAMAISFSIAHADGSDEFSGGDVADVLECAHSDRVNLSALNSLFEEPTKDMKKLSKRLEKFEAFLDRCSADEIAAGEAAVESRRAERKEKLNSMSAVEQSVFMAKSKLPCKQAEKTAKRGSK